MGRIVNQIFDAIGDWIEREAQRRAYDNALRGGLRERAKTIDVELIREKAEKIRLHENPGTPQVIAMALATAAVAKLVSDRYRADLLFDDDEFFGYESWFSVQGFLERRKSFLASYIDPTTERPAADIIEKACKDVDLDQRIILISLQREQSAVGSTTPYPPRKMARILGFGCLDGRTSSDRGVDLEKFYGFTNQITHGARRFVELAHEWKEGTGIKVDFNEAAVIPLNGPTWAHYRYTPHTVAGEVSYKIGKSFFGF